MKKKISNFYDIVIIGAGAAGLLATSKCIENGAKSVLLVDRNNTVGKKLSITGKGRCNITNNCDCDEFLSSVINNRKFLYSAVNFFSPKDTIAFFDSLGLKLKTERGKRVFPLSDRASDVVNVLLKNIKDKCDFAGKKITNVKYENNCFNIFSGNEKITESSKLILACGGVSYPGTGSDGLGFKLAKGLGHTITQIKPSLVPLICKNQCCRELQGLSLRNIAVKVYNYEKERFIFDDFGELMFTHFGLSGPVILSASTHMRCPEVNYRIDIDLKPALTKEQLDKRLQREFSLNLNKSLGNVLLNVLPRKMVPVVIELSGIEYKTKCNSVTKHERKVLVDILKCFSLDVVGFRPIKEAIITSGGIATNEINPASMESKKIKGLYFAGEMIDVDAYTGGFNLQIAFSTGYLAGHKASIDR